MKAFKPSLVGDYLLSQQDHDSTNRHREIFSYYQSGETPRELAKRFGLPRSKIYRIIQCRGRR